VPSHFALVWRARTRLDDSLDVFAAHGLGGVSGALLTGVFAQESVNGVADGLLFGNVRQLAVQAFTVAVVFLYSGLMTFLILKGLSLVMPIRAVLREERLGLDIVNHGEEAYSSGEGALLLMDDEVPTAFLDGSNEDPDAEAGRLATRPVTRSFDA
jgi:Amt family ammonium transporter